jgi:hypothetical protein
MDKIELALDSPRKKHLYLGQTTGAIGELRTVRSFFSYIKLDPNKIRNYAELGGLVAASRLLRVLVVC